MFRRLLSALVLGVAMTALTVRAEPAPVAKPSNSGTTDVAAKQIFEKQQQLLRQYKAVTEDLLSLAHRLEKSNRIEDQDKAKLIRKAIELGDKEGVDNKFQTLLRTLAGKNGNVGLGDVSSAKNQNEDLVRVLKEILAILMSDDEMARIKAEKDFLEARLAELKGIIRETKVGRAIAESGKGNPDKLAKDQDKLKGKTDELANKLEGKQGGMGMGMGMGGMKEAMQGAMQGGMPMDMKMGDPKMGDPKMGGMGMGGMKEGMKGAMQGGMGEPKMGGMGMGGMGMPGMGGQSQPGQPGQKSPGADQVRKAVPDQEDSAKRLQDNNRPKAIEKQTDAITKLQEAQAELEKRLKQLREEELERLLANLEARVAKMLQMQIEVYESTKAIDTIVQKSESKKPEKAEIQKAQQQADKETEIIAEANKAIQILKDEGSAVAFPRVFEEVVIDMTRVRERLNQAKVAKDTQLMEQDIIDSLKEMLEALKKAQQDLQQSKGMPGMGGSGPPPDQKLLDEIAELKMLRNLQVKVNERTKRYGEHEQSTEPQIKVELKDLGNRQERIEEMARDIATGKNK